MTESGITAEQAARWFVEQLRAARRTSGESRRGYAGTVIEALVGLHELTEDGGLPRTVDGQDFKTEAATLLNDMREDVRWEAASIAALVEDARSEDFELALRRRSALQYLADDFRASVADGMIDDDLFDESDEEMAEKLAVNRRKDGPLPQAAVPRHVPPSHWWWEKATLAAPARRQQKSRRLFLLIFAGTLDQAALDNLRGALGLGRRGRLSDREDAFFGGRAVPASDGSMLELELWRDEDAGPDQNPWSIVLTAPVGAQVGAEQIAQLRARSEAAAGSVGLRLAEARVFSVDPPAAYQTEWRNENWLRTAQWDLPAQTLDELWPVLGVASAPVERKRAELARFTTSPAWEAAPAGLREEADGFLRGVNGAR